MSLETLRRTDGDSPEVAKVYLYDGCGNVMVGIRSFRDKKRAGQLDFPGGRRKRFDRSIEETAIRETEEEFGLLLCEADLEFVTVTQSPSKSDSEHPNIITLYKAMIDAEDEKNLSTDSGEIEDAFWMPETIVLEQLENPSQRNDYALFLATAVDLRSLVAA